jgi:hypothetical protein
MYVIQRRGERENEVGPRGRELRVSSVYRIAGEGRRIAKILMVILAIPACAVRAPDPGNTYPCSQSEFRRRPLNNFFHDLVTRNQNFPQGAEFAFNNVEVGPANAARPHP